MKFKFLILAALAVNAWSWTEHSSITKNILLPAEAFQFDINQQVKVTSLADFLARNKTAVATTIRDTDSWAKGNVPGYKATPEAILFNPDSCTDLPTCFVRAIRINPQVPLAPIAYNSGAVTGSTKIIHNIEIEMMPGEYVAILNHLLQDKMRQLSIGEEVSLRDVITANADVPDFGLDVGLYEDDNTTFGKEYGFGKQPIGVAKVPWSSQILFHMSSYYVSSLFFLAKPGIKSSYPEYRFHLYASLARLAYEHNDPYWAGVFAGWSMHYVQDMTQPYHGYLFPGYSTAEVMLSSLIEPVYSKPAATIRNNLTARHELAENTAAIILNSNTPAALTLAQALQDSAGDDKIPHCNLSTPYVRNVVNQNSYAISSQFSAHIVKDFPPQISSSGKAFDPDTVGWESIFQRMSPLQQQDYLDTIAERFRITGSYTRSCLNLIFSKK